MIRRPFTAELGNQESLVCRFLHERFTSELRQIVRDLAAELAAGVLSNRQLNGAGSTPSVRLSTACPRFLNNRKGDADGGIRRGLGASYGPAYLVTPDDAGSASAELVEDGVHLLQHEGVPPARADGAIAFVDGVRRGEASLWQEDSAGRTGRGVAGGHACGAVIADSANVAFGDSRVQRMVIWGSGMTGRLPDIRGGWTWAVASVADDKPDLYSSIASWISSGVNEA